VQSYLIASVRSAFAALTGLPDTPSNQIEDLQELDIIDPALQGLRALAERQARIEESQDRAREAWRDLVTQIRGLHGVLPAVEAVQFIKNQYRALTGSDIDSGTQERLL